jgi:UDP-N-acetylglucosamine 2-epimerase (non-hydrolysing)
MDNKRKLKVMTILGTRPEIIRLSEVIKKCDKEFDHILVHTGQNYDYELNGIFFKELGVRKPDYALNCVGKNLGETMGLVISKTYDLIQEVKPDAILILGDTNSALSAISAKRLKTPIFHMEAGNRCWDWNVAEMTNRTIVDHISDINMPYSHFAYNNLIREGLRKDRTFITGSPMLEVINAHRKEIDSCNILTELGLTKGKYIVMSAHREENVDIPEKFNRLFPSLNKIAYHYKMPVIFSVHPRTRKKFEEQGFQLSKYIREDKPFGFFEYCQLERNAFVVLSDSGTLTEESSIFDFPGVLIRTSTERQEGVENGSIAIGGVDYKTIMLATERAREIHRSGNNIKIVPDYDEKKVSSKVVKITKKYISIINKETWNK